MTIYIILIILFLIASILFANYLYNYLLIPKEPPFKDPNPFGYCNISKQYVKPFEVKNILTELECNALINYCYDEKTENNKTAGIYVNNTNNLVTWIPKTDPLVKNIVEKMAEMFKMPFSNAENVRVTRYFPNQSFNDRFDSCCEDTLRCRNFMKFGGPRKVSIIIYLTDDYKGGETLFQNVGVSFKPKKGDGIVFYPMDAQTNKCHPALSYSGLPIDYGVKWIMNIWFRESSIENANDLGYPPSVSLLNV